MTQQKHNVCCALIQSKKSRNYGKQCSRQSKLSISGLHYCGLHRNVFRKINVIKSKTKELDQYYTVPSISKLCVETWKKKLKIDFLRDLLIEPSAGNGSFLNYIKNKNSSNTLFLDVEPKLPGIIEADFLTYESKNKLNFKDVHVLGNPPFKLVKKFIKRSDEFWGAASISFILPASFKKESLKKFFPLCYHLIFELDLTNQKDKNFIFNNVLTHVPTVFQIWSRKNLLRIDQPKILTSPFFIFRKKSQDHDLAIRRCGASAGKLFLNTADLSVSTNYFLKLKPGVEFDWFISQFSLVSFSNNNFTRIKSISKPELILSFFLTIKTK